MPIADAILEGIGFTIGGKVVDHVHKKMMGTKKKRKNSAQKTVVYTRHPGAAEYYYPKEDKKKEKKKNSGEFIGVRINGSKVQLRVPNKNPTTLRQAKKVASKLGYKIKLVKRES